MSRQLSSSRPETLIWHQQRLQILNQTLLPGRVSMETMADVTDVWNAIYELRVRGAPAIGVAAAYGLCVAMQPFKHMSPAEFTQKLNEQANYLNSARPTAVNLSWALNRLTGFLGNYQQENAQANSQLLWNVLEQEAIRIHKQDQQLCEAIGQAGLPLINPGMGILTHCNAGALATTGLGTATAPMYLAHEAGTAFRIFADETRPLLQGARLTSWELHQAGIDVTLITDNMAAWMMAQGHIDLVITGADRVAANGDAANKIGTLSLAINARHFGIPFYIAFPSSTLDLNCPTGADIYIEERNADEVRILAGSAVTSADMPVRNPAFDVTPAELITGFITDHGIIKPPYQQSLATISAAD